MIQRGEDPVLFSDDNTFFLQNIQNCRSNTLRYKVNQDELQQMTRPYDCPNAEIRNAEEEEEEEQVAIEETPYEAFAEILENEEDDVDPGDNAPISRVLGTCAKF